MLLHCKNDNKTKNTNTRVTWYDLRQAMYEKQMQKV